MYAFGKLRFVVPLYALIFASVATPRYYRPEDWVTYTDFRHISCVAVDLSYVYLATRGGIVRFNRITGRWDDPLTIGDGLPQTPVTIVAPDPASRSLWLLTGTSLSRYEQVLERWRSFSSLAGAPAAAVEAIGVGSEYIYAKAGGSTLRTDRVQEVWEPSPSPPPQVRWFGGEPDLEKYPFLAPYYVLDSRFRSYDMTSMDRDGFDIWVGTSGYGLFHYNSQTLGRDHRPYGLAGESVRAIDKDGVTLWIGGDSDGITSWNQSEDRWTYYDEELSYGLLSSEVAEIVSDSLWVWFGTREGVSRYDRAEGDWKTFTIFEGLWANSITALEVDGSILWIGTEGGLCRMEKDDEKISRIKEFKRVEINDIVGGPFYTWVATSRGVFVFDRDEGKWRRFESPDQSLGLGTNSILLDEGGIWLGTQSRGVVYYGGEKGSWKNYTAPVHLISSEVLCLGADEANLWVGTPSGVSRFNKQRETWTTYTTLDGLISNRVEAILVDGDYAYFGTPKGLTKFWWNDPFLPK